ncbi:uncharacterized protein N7518_000876 [Penicillium psychrosexuale]|uniref:uncharacterized protein n=1 Tax=Penicillium psychrosexuale TaxID=1002107 RepID=UPI0025455201|nr:uncharacterized protein N7518_000876 [Penicillium psychrosexuale]KAJ5804573.1 hypothetical protein N7518_000876 [Penicillium psychrosexuale]
MTSSPWTKPDTSTRPIAVIGGGIMGRRIANMLIAAGFPVILCEKAGNYSSAVRYIEEHKGEQAAKLGTHPAELKTTSSLPEAVKDA